MTAIITPNNDITDLQPVAPTNGEAGGLIDTNAVRATLLTGMDDLNKSFIDRTEVIELLVICLLARQHGFLLGPPGTAKSELIAALANMVKARKFRRLLTKFTPPEEIVGPLDMTALKTGRYERITTTYLPDVEVAFLDEIFKASSAILNYLLTMLNEREFVNDGQTLSIPLVSAFAASNELPEDAENLGALYDRFMARVYIPAADDANLKLIMQDLPPPPVGLISLGELAACQAAVEQVKVDDDVIDAMVQLRMRLREEKGITASERRWKAMKKLVRAKAWLEGETEADEDHLEVLTYCIAFDPKKDTEHVRSIVASVGNPANQKADEIDRALKEALAEIGSEPTAADGEGRDAWVQRASKVSGRLTQMQKELTELEGKYASRKLKRLKKVQTKVNAARHDIVTKIAAIFS